MRPKNTGMTALVYADVDKNGPGEFKAIATRMGVAEQRVKSALAHLKSEGRLVAISEKPMVYGLIRDRPAVPFNPRVAGKVVVPQYRWGSTRLG